MLVSFKLLKISWFFLFCSEINILLFVFGLLYCKMFYNREDFEKLLKTNVFTLFSKNIQAFKVIISVAIAVLLFILKKYILYEIEV